MKSLDVAHINPFLQSSISVIEMTTQVKQLVNRDCQSLIFREKHFFCR